MRVFIGTSDYADLVLLPGVMARLGREAPRVELRVLTLRDDPGSDLASGKLDVVLMPPLPSEEGPSIRSLQIFGLWRTFASC